MKPGKNRDSQNLFSERPKKPLRLFGILTIIIAACVAGFVVIIYISMIRGAVNESDYVRIIEGGVPTQLRAIAFEMEQWAVHISKDTHIKQLAEKGLRALESEGGKKGGQATEIIRRQIRNRILLNWGMLSQDPRPKEIQIFLGHDMTSLIWLNRPEIYGFSRNIKETLLYESYQTLLPVSGFEA